MINCLHNCFSSHDYRPSPIYYRTRFISPVRATKLQLSDGEHVWVLQSALPHHSVTKSAPPSPPPGTAPLILPPLVTA